MVQRVLQVPPGVQRRAPRGTTCTGTQPGASDVASGAPVTPGPLALEPEPFYNLLMFTSTPILKHFDPKWEIVIETDASNFAVGCILSQRWENRLHPVAFHSHKLSKPERNYDIYDKELLAIVVAFKIWHHYCQGAQHPITILTDHRNLLYFSTTKKLNQRQAGWAEKLAQYNFCIKYRPGTSSGKPDALSRRPEYDVEGEGVIDSPPILKPELFISSTTTYRPLLVIRLQPDAKLPIQGSDMSAGVDIMANKRTQIEPRKRELVKTGIAIATPANCYARIAPRSGLAAKYNIDIGAGVVDQDYQGEIGVLMINNSTKPFQVRPGDRIAQLIIEQILLTTPTETNNLDNTIRGTGGFGSTGYQDILSSKTLVTINAILFEKPFLDIIKKAGMDDPGYREII